MNTMDILTQPSPKRQRIRLFFMGSTYALGTFNDNFFKQSASLLALSYGLKQLQGDATMLFALPFVLFSAWAGWLADRLPKTAIVKWAKALELAAMCCGAYGLITLDWNFILIMVGTMGLQSTLFSPALNGSIPETFPAEDVPKINAILKLATTVTILLGIASAGFALDQTWGQSLLPEHIDFGRFFVSAIAIFAALAGLAAALFLSRSKSANPGAKFQGILAPKPRRCGRPNLPSYWPGHTSLHCRIIAHYVAKPKQNPGNEPFLAGPALAP